MSNASAAENVSETVDDCDYRAILTKDDLLAAVASCRTAGRIAVDTETNSTDPMRAKLVGISLSWEPRQGVYIPVAHAYAAHDAIPGSELCVLEHVGHFPHAEAPELFLEVLTDFLATTEPGVAAPGGLRELLHVG